MWQSLIKAVIELTNRRDYEVFQMSVMDFFAWVAYAKKLQNERENELRQMRARNGH